MKSEIKNLGDCEFPAFTGMRIMMMPFRMNDANTVPAQYRALVADLIARNYTPNAVGYLTIDEAHVPRGEYHRRPGLHVDGGEACSWGGDPGPWGGPHGMIIAASHYACNAYAQDFVGTAGEDNNCEHLRAQLREVTPMHGGYAYWMSPTCVHESIPASHNMQRQFVRISYPSTAPWYAGYTESPYGVEPTGPVFAGRTMQMSHRT